MNTASNLLVLSAVCLAAGILVGGAPTRSFDEATFAEPSELAAIELERRGSSSIERGAAASESGVPVYVSPFARASGEVVSYDPSESSLAPGEFLPLPALESASKGDLRTAASYHGHGYSGHQHYDTSGWLDMGAYTGHKGAFGWHAGYPVGGHKYHSY